MVAQRSAYRANGHSPDAGGESQARAAAGRLGEFDVVAPYASPLLRARRTAELLGLRDIVLLPELMEWDYGGYEGLTTEAISAESGRPWSLWDDGVPPGKTPGESIEEVADRARTVLAIVALHLGSGDVVVVAHAISCASWPASTFVRRPDSGLTWCWTPVP